MLDTPVALIIFNRPETTAQVVASIAAAKPLHLFVIADGPRPHRPDDVRRCAAARAIVEEIDWSCPVTKNYANTNLGCRLRVSSGITWLFEQVEEAIILEDDCLPHSSFFPYCTQLLDRYREDTRVMHIGGSNLQLGYRHNPQSYYFSRYAHVWGWATWRRAWQHYDVRMQKWPAFRDGSWLSDWLQDRSATAYWRGAFQSTYESSSTWDVQWLFTCWTQGALSTVPAVNLVANIGGSLEGTHTQKNNWTLVQPARPLPFPLKHPEFPIVDISADRFAQKTLFRSSLMDRVQGKVWRLWRAARFRSLAATPMSDTSQG